MFLYIWFFCEILRKKPLFRDISRSEKQILAGGGSNFVSNTEQKDKNLNCDFYCFLRELLQNIKFLDSNY